jgi:surface protein
MQKMSTGATAQGESILPVAYPVTSVADETTADDEEKQLSWTHVALISVGVLLAVTAVVLASVCGSGNCDGEGSSSSSDITTESTPRPPPTKRAFATTRELYEAVDNYLTSLIANTSIVARTYGYPIGTWDVSTVKNFTRLFDPDRDLLFDIERTSSGSAFNEDLSGWNLSAAETLFGMFRGSTSFNGNITGWDVSNVRNFSYMFDQAHAL